MKRVLILAAIAASVAACGAKPGACVPKWSADYTEKLAREADRLAPGSPIRTALAEYGSLRSDVPRCD